MPYLITFPTFYLPGTLLILFTNSYGECVVNNQAKPAMNDEEWFDYSEAARFLDTPIGTLQVWVSTNRYAIPYYKIGRNVRFKKSELAAWMDTRKRGGALAAQIPHLCTS